MYKDYWFLLIDVVSYWIIIVLLYVLLLILLDFSSKNSYPNIVIDLSPPFLCFLNTLYFHTSNSFFLSNFVK